MTMADVARSAGVSKSTVSHVINKTRHVSEDVRALVFQAIEETGYVPNTLARSLKTANSSSIALAISIKSNPYFGDLVHAVESSASDHGLTLLFSDTHDESEQELRVVRALRGRRVDGAILTPSAQPKPVLDYLKTHRLPVVLLDRLASSDFDQVGSENLEAVAQLIEHLATKGHSRIGMVSGREGLTTTEERAEGYRRGLERADLTLDPALVRTGASSFEPARQAAHELLDQPQPPTALFAANNQMTIGVMRALQDRRLRVPDDIALVAFDDFEWADLFSPRLTTIAQPCVDIGRTAVQLLVQRMAEPDRPPRTVRLTPTVMHRRSCGC